MYKQKFQRKFAALAIVVLSCVGFCPVRAANLKQYNPFTDVRSNDSYYEAILYCYENDIYAGISDDEFAPNGNLTRAMFVTLLGRVAESMGLRTAGYSSSFEDVEEGSWYEPYVAWAAKKGIVNGMSEKEFDPHANVTREQASAIVVRFASKAGLELDASKVYNFRDEDAVSSWAVKEMETAIAAGLAIGYDESRLSPQKSATRAETAGVLYILCDEYIKDTKLTEVSGKFVKVIEGLPVNSYPWEYFGEKNTHKYYNDGEIESVLGVDVSQHQKEIDWQKVSKAGIEFAMIRVGYRGYSVGAIMEDEYYIANIEGALDNGIDVGVYFFSQATSVAEALEEAEFLLERIEGYDITYPVVFDWETISGASARTDNITTKTLNACAVAFCDAVEDAGYIPMVYTNQHTALLLYDLEGIQNYAFWLAEYNTLPRFYYDFQMWQYTDAGKVDGINGKVDMNLSFVDYDVLKRRSRLLSSL